MRRTNPKHLRLDVLNLHVQIMKMVGMFKELDYQLDRVLADNTLNIEFVRFVISIFHESKSDIAQIINILGRMSNLSAKIEEDAFPEGLIPIGLLKQSEPNGDESILHGEIMRMTSKHACLVGLLSCAGLDILYGDPLLSKADEDKQKDFLKYLEIVYKSNSGFLDFNGTHSNDVMCYAIIEKAPNLMHEALKKAFELMEVCLDNRTFTANDGNTQL